MKNLHILQGRWELPLSFVERIKIAFGTAEGIKHLHEYSDPPLVHRDVKSANILLGRDLIPKVRVVVLILHHSLCFKITNDVL